MLLLPDIRLADVTGRLEVEQDGVWGTVCHVGWSSKESVLICRHLGFYTGIRLDMDVTLPDALHLPVHYQGHTSTTAELALLHTPL